MRKTFAGCFVALLLVGLMAGCGGGGAPGQPAGSTAMATVAPVTAPGEVDALSVTTFHSVADTFINQAAPGANFGSRRVMLAGNYWGGGPRLSMVRFDLARLPANATVNRASLRLYMVVDHRNPSTYAVHRISKPWAETGATWATHGAAYLAPVTSRIVQPTMVGSYVEFGVRDLVRTWVATPGRNYGCLVRRVEGSKPTAVGVEFATREYLGRDPLLVVDYSTPAAGPAPVALGSAGNYVILAKAAISTTGTTSVVGNIGLSPAARSYFTGFSEVLDPTNVFARSSLVTGKMYAANMAPPTPANLTTAIGNMETAFTNAAGRTLPDFTELGAGNLDGKTLVPGLYKWGTGVTIPHRITLSGGANDVWIFQIASNLTVGNGAIVALSGGAQAKNIFWQVSGQTALGTNSQFKGIILCKTQIVLRTGAALKGRALAQTAVTLDANAVTQPAL